MTLKELKELALCAAKRTPPANYTMDSVNAALADGLREMCGSINSFMKNRYDLYDIIVEAADEVVPRNVINAIGIFADVQVVPQGTKAIFKRPVGRQRAKQFLTEVGLSGVYETFRLDTETFEVSPKAVGIAATIDFERMLDNAETLSEVMDVMTECLSESVFVEVHKALRAALNAKGRPMENKHIDSGFNANNMVKMMNVVRAYGDGVVIFAPPEFIAAMGADAIVPVAADNKLPGVYHPQDIDAIHNTGYINIFRGAPIVQIPQSYVDENNDKTYIDPQIAYVLPTGRSRVVKVVLEGQTQIYDWQNKDNSLEIHAYRKIGVAILSHHDWGIYQNTAIHQTYKNPYEGLED